MTVDRRIIELYNESVHTALPRREFLARLTRMAGGAAAAMTALAVLEPNYAQAQQVPPEDKRLNCEHISFNGPDGPIKAYSARPHKIKHTDKLGGIVVMHENRGLNGYIEDVARRCALAGYLTIAADGLSVAGGTPADQEAARDLFDKTNGARIASDMLSGIQWVAADPSSNGKIGALGFGYGGGVALRSTVENLGVDAAVAFYGKQLSAEETKHLHVPVLLQYASDDERIDAGIPDFKAALEANHVTYQMFTYPGTQYGFHNDSMAARYNEEAARLAWQRTLDFFATYLKV